MLKYTSIILLAVLISCSTKDSSSVAYVGNETIDKDWFTETFTLNPQFRTNSTLKDAYLQHLDYLIEQRYLSLAAQADQIDTLSEIKSRLQYVRHKELLKALYMQEISDKIVVSDKQAWDEYKKQNLMVSARHLFSPSLNKIKEYKHQLDEGVRFEELAKHVFKDSVLADNGGYLGYIKITDFDPYLVDSIYTLKIGMPSEVLKSSIGYHIFRIDDIKQSTILDKEYFDSNKDYFADEVAQRQARFMSDQFVKKVLKGKSVTINSATLNKVLNVTRKYVQERPQQPAMLQITVTDQELGLILNESDLIKDEVLVDFPDGQWTVYTFFLKLKQMPPMHRPSLLNKDILASQIIDLVRDEYLLKEAKQRKLDQDKSYLTKYNNYRTQILAAEFSRLIQMAYIKQENPQKWRERRELLYELKEKHKLIVDSTALFIGLSEKILETKIPRIYTVIREQYLW